MIGGRHIDLAAGAKLHLAPNAGSYVGGDITSGTLASMMWNRPELSLLIDLVSPLGPDSRGIIAHERSMRRPSAGA